MKIDYTSEDVIILSTWVAAVRQLNIYLYIQRLLAMNVNWKSTLTLAGVAIN